MALSAAPSIIPTPAILTFNPAPISSGSPTPLAAFFPATTNVTSQAFPTGGGVSSLAVTSAFVSQDQLNSQFRDFAINSQAVQNQFIQTTADILFGAYGFGSGTTPNAPWMPAAYNLGLGNHQFNYSLQPDLGY
jgi:hypothetical protein